MEKSHMKVHPLADRYPMLPDDEIAELATDIKAHGLIHQIVVDGDTVIDGRNRLRACELAGVDPSFRPFPWNGNADDAAGKEEAIKAYIVGENIRRRHLNAGQRAILVAIAYPETGNRWRSDSKIESEQVHPGVLSQARCIVNSAPDLVDQVIAGGMYFNTAYEEAARRRQATELVAGQMERLRKEASDLANIVLEERGMTASEAIAALDKRLKDAADELDAKQRKEQAEAEAAKLEHERQRRVMTQQIGMVLSVLSMPPEFSPQDIAGNIMLLLDHDVLSAGQFPDFTVARLELCREVLDLLIEEKTQGDLPLRDRKRGGGNQPWVAMGISKSKYYRDINSGKLSPDAGNSDQNGHDKATAGNE
jgi:hypothetical protein